MMQPTTVNISWPPENDANGTGSIVLQVHLDGQARQTVQEPKTEPGSAALSEKLAATIIAGNVSGLNLLRYSAIHKSYRLDVDQDLFRPPSILLHTPVKGIGWSASSTASSLPETPNRLHGIFKKPETL